ncbi:MAG: hypothetical protein DBX47_05920 [Clostridiales bacterium]|nr:MAG: hypothetical protein DBX47_05920 [Clostridiales bacterium]
MSKILKALSFVLIFVLFINTLIFSLSAEEEVTEWNYYNSIIVSVTVHGQKIFTPENFSEVDCTKALVIEKDVSEISKYKMILILNQVYTDEEIEATVSAIKLNPIVTSAERNYYAPFESTIELNESQLKLKVGEKFDLKITKNNFCYNDRIGNDLMIVLDPQIYDISQIKDDSFSEQGVTIKYLEAIDVKPSDPLFLEVNQLSDAATIEAMNNLSQLPGVIYVDFEPVCGCWQTEVWKTSDESTVNFTEDLSSDEKKDIIGKTVTIEGLKTGTAEISVIREGTSIEHIEASCTVTVYLPGDLTNDGKVTLPDAMTLFKYIAGKITLEKSQTYAADMNEDNEIRLDDAMRLFKYISGKK